MTVAYITGDREALLSIFSDPDKFSAAAPFTYLMASLIVLIFGPGRYSLDCLIERFWLGDSSARCALELEMVGAGQARCCSAGQS